MTTMWGLIVAGVFISIGLHRVANAIDGMTQVWKSDIEMALSQGDYVE